MSSEVLAKPTKPYRDSFFVGLTTALRGFGYMNRNKGLWRFALLPTLVNALITLGLLVALIVVCTTIVGWRNFGDQGLSFWGVTLEVLIAIGMIVVALALTLITWWLMQGILMGYFYNQLAAKVERKLGVAEDELGEVPLKHEIIDTLIDTAWLVLLILAFILLQLLPVIGTTLGLIGWLYFNGYIFGRDILDHPLTLRGQRRVDRRAFARKHRKTVVGLGLVSFSVNVIPILGPMLQTASVVGAVLLHRKMRGDAST